MTEEIFIGSAFAQVAMDTKRWERLARQQEAENNDEKSLARIEIALAAPHRLPDQENAEMREQQRTRKQAVDTPCERCVKRQQHRTERSRPDAGEFDEARQAVNRQLVEQLGKRRGSFSGLLHTVHITFDNSQSPTDTVMDIQSDDTPAFLYAFANALAMRNIYIDKAQFAIEGGKLHDRFYVRNRHGQKLTDPADQQHLRLTAVLIKQFTHALT